jgi:hypothetical protein
MLPLPSRCPLCTGPVHVERIRCDACASAVEGHFSLEWTGALSPEQLRFVRVFLACRGKIKDVEQALGLSYPTVVSRLDDVVTALGASAPVFPTAPAPPPASTPAEPQTDVLKALADGAIDVDEAERRLRQKR